METNPTQHCDHCGIGPFFNVAGREYPTLCLDCADIASADGLLTWTDKGTTWFPSSATNAAIRADEARVSTLSRWSEMAADMSPADWADARADAR